MEKAFVDKAFQECGDDVDSIINKLTQLDIGSSQTGVHQLPSSSQQVAVSGTGDTIHPPHHQDCNPRTGTEWVELFACEIKSASSMNEAKECASRLLGVLENSMRSNEGEAVKILEKENLMLKHNLEKATSNSIIFRQVVLKLLEGRRSMNQELENFRQIVAQHEQRSKELERDNYVLSMHVRQAMMMTQNKHISNNFLPDLF